MKNKEEILWTAKPSQILNLGWFLSCFFLVTIPFALWQWLVTLNNRYTLSSERFIHKEGVFNRNVEHLELYRVKDYSLSIPLILRLFGLSNIVLKTSDPTTPTVIINGVRNGEKVLDIIRERVEHLRQTKGVREID